MPESLNAERETPVVENRAPKPQGILPRNAQAMVIAGIAAIMVSAIAFSGSAGYGLKRERTRRPLQTTRCALGFSTSQ
jgi:hypothetical protein